MSQEKKFYVYVHRYASGPKEGQVFYVGKGSGNRLISKAHRNRHWKNVVSKYGHTCEILMMFSAEECAFGFERALISYYGIDNLCNYTYGGEGTSGYKFDRLTVLEKAKKCMKPVINSNGDVFNSLKDAKDFCIGLGYSKATESHISSCCNGIRHVAYGFSWSFDIENTPELIDASQKVNECRVRSVISSRGDVFRSVSSAAKWCRDVLGVRCGTSDISRCCKGSRKLCAGLSWRYADD